MLEPEKHQELGSVATSVVMGVAIGLACQGMGIVTNRLFQEGPSTTTDRAVFFVLLGLVVLGVDFLLYEVNYAAVFSRLSVFLNLVNSGLTVVLAAVVGDPGFQATRSSIVVIALLAGAQAALYYLNWVRLVGPSLPPRLRRLKRVSNATVVLLSVVLLVLAVRGTRPDMALWVVVLVFGGVVAVYVGLSWWFLLGSPKTVRSAPN